MFIPIQNINTKQIGVDLLNLNLTAHSIPQFFHHYYMVARVLTRPPDIVPDGIEAVALHAPLVQFERSEVLEAGGGAAALP
jgi:glycerol-3-phosphate O-acyltransferase